MLRPPAGTADAEGGWKGTQAAGLPQPTPWDPPDPPSPGGSSPLPCAPGLSRCSQLPWDAAAPSWKMLPGTPGLDPPGGEGSGVGVRWGGVGWGQLQGKSLRCLTAAPTSPSSASVLRILQSAAHPSSRGRICVSAPGLYSPLAHSRSGAW